MECAYYFLKRVPLGVSPSVKSTRKHSTRNRGADAAPLAKALETKTPQRVAEVF